MMIGQQISKIIGYSVTECDIEFRVHATQRMFQRGIAHDAVIALIADGIVIESYPDDMPFPSVLINGTTSTGRSIHGVVGADVSGKRLYVVTVYDPDPSKWRSGFSKRILS